MKELLVSKKFWLTVIPMVGTAVLYARGGIDATHLSDVLTAGFGVLVLAIAHENNGTNSAGGPS